jgi:hypothetical protein
VDWPPISNVMLDQIFERFATESPITAMAIG